MNVKSVIQIKGILFFYHVNILIHVIYALQKFAWNLINVLFVEYVRKIKKYLDKKINKLVTKLRKNAK